MKALNQRWFLSLGLAAGVVMSAFNVSVAGAATRLETEVAAAAGRVANTAVSRAVLKDAARLRGPACRAGARDLGLHGIKHAVFVAECAKVL